MRNAFSKARLFVIALGVLVAVLSVALYHHRARAVPSFARSDSESENIQTNPGYAEPRQLASLKDPAVKESSGLVASRTNPGLYWTHNDSGDGPYLYAFDAEGKQRGVWQVSNAKARDWEAMAAGPGPDSSKNYLYVGDIGDNGERRREVVVYRVVEPQITSANAATTKRKPAVTEPAESIRLRYPNGAANAETLLVHPKSGDVYIVTKEVFASPRVFQAKSPLNLSEVVILKELGSLNIPGLFGGVITDGSISPDGRRVVLCDYTRGYELVLPASNGDFDSIWKQRLEPLSLGSRKQGEAVTYRLDGRALLATSEGYPMPLIEVARK